MLALDIGGAHIKGYHRDGRTFHESFEVWRRPDRLGRALEGCLAQLLPFDDLAITTTAELCDCFETRREGVLAIVNATCEALRAVAPDATLHVWTLEGQLVSRDEALQNPDLVAAANWLALACHAAQRFPGEPSLLADMGSTTVDLIPMREGSPNPRERTDTGRLISGELVYTGARRTPTFALRPVLTYRGKECPVIPELFATMSDVYVVLGQLAENSDDRHTADGRARTRDRACERLARTVGADRDSFDMNDAELLARELAESQIELITIALCKIASTLNEPPHTVILSGEGESIVGAAVQRQWPGVRTESLASEISKKASSVACAYSLVEIMTRIPARSSPGASPR